MKNSFKKRAGRATVAGATLLGLSAAGLAFAAPASAATPTDLVQGPIAASTTYIKADGTSANYSNLAAGVADGTIPLWTYPAAGAAGTISLGGKCLQTPASTGNPTTFVTCDDTVPAQRWSGVLNGTEFYLQSVSTNLYLSPGTSTSRAYKATTDLQAGYALTTPAVVAPSLTTPRPGTTITPDTVFSGVAEQNTIITVLDTDGNVLGTATAGADKTWSLVLDTPPVNGSVVLKIVALDTGGVSTNLANGSYTMTGSEERSSYTGPTSGNVTPDTEYTGTGAKGETVTITDKDGTVLGSTTIGDDGTWSLTLDPAPMNGSTDLTISIGGQKVADVNVTMTGSDEPRALTSPEAGSPITPDTEFSGTGNIGDVVTIKDKDGNVLGTAEVGDDGKWSTTLNPAPDNGTIDLVIEITGKDNKTEELANGSYEMTDSTTKFEVLTPNLGASGGSVTNDTVFTGKGEPGTTVVITDKDGKPVGQTTVDENGDWSTPITGLPEGPNSLEITYTVPGKDAVTIDLGAVTIVAGTAGDPVMDPSIAGGIGMVLLAAAGAYTGLRRRRTATQQ